MRDAFRVWEAAVWIRSHMTALFCFLFFYCKAPGVARRHTWTLVAPASLAHTGQPEREARFGADGSERVCVCAYACV